jgi:hypothetical protein
MLNSIAVGLALVQASVGAQEEEIIGYQYVCEAVMNDPFKTSAPSLTARLTIDEAGVKKEFWADYNLAWGKEYADFRGEKPANMTKNKTHMRWSLKWQIVDNSFSQNDINFNFEDAALVLDFHSWRTLPKNVVMLVARGGNPYLLHWRSSLHSFSERWTGRKTGAAFAFPLGNIMATTTGTDELGWAIYNSPLKQDMSYKDRRGEGVIDLKPVKAVASDFEKVRSEILTKAADFKNKCRKDPIHYNPDADI